MSALSDKIKSDLVKLSKSDKHLQSIIKRLESGNANLADVDDFAQATGTVLKKVFEKSITESPKAFTDEQLIAEILGDIFGDNYDLINSVAENIQKQLDKVAGIGIKPQRSDFPSERIENLAKVTAQKDLTDKTSLSEFTASVENINGSIFTDYVKTNADFRSKAGLRVYVIRSDHSKCCAWCSKLAGKYVYPDVPKDVWRRHKRCTCEITYVNEKAGTYDKISYSDVQNGKEIETRKQVTRLTPEQARAKEKEVLKRLDKRGGSGIMKENSSMAKFIPADTIENAKEYTLKFADKVNVKNVKNLNSLNTVNETLTDLTAKYPVDKLQDINCSSTLKKANAQANGGGLDISTKYLNEPPAMVTDWKTRNEQFAKLIPEYQAAISSGKYSAAQVRELKRKLAQMEEGMKYTRWSISSTFSGTNAVKATVAHEYGHIIADQYFGQINRGLYCKNYGDPRSVKIKSMVDDAFRKAKQTGDIYNISQYASTNSHEFFAECFCAHYHGEEFPDYIEQMLKEALTK